MSREVFGELGAVWLPRKGKWKLTKPLRYCHKGEVITVPKGFETDLDSVPRIPYAYAYLKGRAMASAVVHDWLYFAQTGKRYADKVFNDAMKDEGVPARHRLPIYWAVVVGGHAAYRSHGAQA